MGRASKDCCCVEPTTLNSGPMGGVTGRMYYRCVIWLHILCILLIII